MEKRKFNKPFQKKNNQRAHLRISSEAKQKFLAAVVRKYGVDNQYGNIGYEMKKEKIVWMTKR